MSTSLEKLTRVLLLRHAETAAPHLWHGAESDIELSAQGLANAIALAPTLAREQPSVVISSAMRRAVATAEPIAAACGVPLQIEPDLHERRIGPLSGQPFDDSNELWNETLRRWHAGETSYAPPGSESFDALRARVLPVWNRLAEQHAGTTYVIVAHGGGIHALLQCLLGFQSANAGFRCENLAIHRLSLVSNRWAVVPGS